MIIIVCVDDNNGMLFNNRRQSQDRKLRERILNLTKGSKLYMNSYSYMQFLKDTNINSIIVDEDFLTKASNTDYCFIENTSLASYKDKIDKAIIYKWNRSYPSDVELDISINDTWQLIEKNDFKGFSHDKITEEIYLHD